MRIAFVTPELGSLVRRSNLASVAESLAAALAQGNRDVRVFLPWTRDVDTTSIGEMLEVASIRVPDGTGEQTVGIFEGQMGPLRIYLIENNAFFGSRHPYGDDEGPYADNWRRYALFARAVLAAMEPLGFAPDIIHCMDWTTGMLPLIQDLEYIQPKPDHPVSKAGTYFAIHNLAMQGSFEREVLPAMGIPHKYFRFINGIELSGKVNFLKAGAEFATVIGTHSPSHAERLSEKDRGFGLENTFERRKKEVVGVSNGIDYQAWNPEDDRSLIAGYGPKSKDLIGKRKCKAALQSTLRLDNGPRTPVAFTMGRWDADSGFDLVAGILNEVLERNVELVVMGSGSQEIGLRLSTLESAFIGRIRMIEGYNAHTAHLLMGGADLVLLPTHYQPSNPLVPIAMRYGVVPIVYGQSGLESMVFDYQKNARKGTGFQFTPYTSDGLMATTIDAIKVYKDAAKWKSLVRRCLNQDFSWEATAQEYLKAYRRVTRRVKARVEGE